MKKICALLGVLAVLFLSGCMPVDPAADQKVLTMRTWFFEYDAETEEYRLHFGLLNRNAQYIAAEAFVDIRIVNDDGVEVYRGTRTVTESDFGNFVSPEHGERYLADVRIPGSEVMPGDASGGTVYFTVYKEGVLQFDEVSCEASGCLPTPKAYD